jgi:hypothetical protein
MSGSEQSYFKIVGVVNKGQEHRLRQLINEVFDLNNPHSEERLVLEGIGFVLGVELE